MPVTNLTHTDLNDNIWSLLNVRHEMDCTAQDSQIRFVSSFSQGLSLLLPILTWLHAQHSYPQVNKQARYGGAYYGFSN